MAVSTRSRFGIPVVGVLMAVGGLVGPAAASTPSPSGCPSEAVSMFMDHFNSNHLSETALGAEEIVSDPASWVGTHEELFTGMAGKATGSCGEGGERGGGYTP